MKDEYLVQCSWCETYKRPDGQYDSRYKPAITATTKISHGMCPSDFARATEEYYERTILGQTGGLEGTVGEY